MVFISGQKKKNKKLDKNSLIIENGQDLSYTESVLQKSFSVPEINSETCSINSLNISDSWYIVMMLKVDWKKRVNVIIWLWLYISLSRQSSSQIQQSHSHLHSRPSRSLLWWQHEISGYKVRDALQTRGIQTPMQHISTPWKKEIPLYFHSIIQMWSAKALKLSWSLSGVQTRRLGCCNPKSWFIIIITNNFLEVKFTT